MDQGAGRTIQDLTVAFEQLAARGLLRLDDAAVAAAQFNWLIMSRPINQAMLLGRDTTPDPADIAEFVNDGLRTFMSAYGPQP